MELGYLENGFTCRERGTSWLRLLSRVNPLTCQVDALRGLMIRSGRSGFELGSDILMQGIVLLSFRTLRGPAQTTGPHTTTYISPD